MFAQNPKSVKFAKCVRKEYEPEVNGHLAYSLSEINHMVQQGKPISLSNAENMYYDGSEQCTFDLPLDQRRGVDINDMWQHSKDVKKTMSKLGVSSVNPT